MKVALVYDRVNKWGGAERLLLVLHKMFPTAPLYTSVYDSKKALWAKVFPKVIPSFLQKIPFAKNNHELLAPLMPIAFESFNFDTYDLVISVTSEAAKGIIVSPKTRHVCICLTPTRYLWSGFEQYFESQTLKVLLRPIINYLRKWDRIGAHRPDKLIAISHEVQRRIRQYYNLESQVIFPPTPQLKSKGLNVKTKSKKQRSYYLVVARLVDYKKVDLVIEAFNNLNLSLKIAGTGRKEDDLKAIAKKNVEFLGEVTDDQLVKYYQNAKALIMPQEEDFGLVSLEAQSFGTPVIAYERGGAADTVVHKKTGILFGSQTRESIEKAVLAFEQLEFDDKIIKDRVKKFSGKSFRKQILKSLKI